MQKDFNITTKYTEELNFTLKTPQDKSLTHRAIIFASLSKGNTIISNYLDSEDTNITIDFFKNLGVSILKKSPSILLVESLGYNKFQPSSLYLYFGNSGTSLRLLLGILTGMDFTFHLSGDDSLSKRSMAGVLDPLQKMGLTVLNNKSKLPLIVKGTETVKGISYFSNQGSAQIKSSIMLASLYSKDKIDYTESKLTRDHTENFFKLYNLNIKEEYLANGKKISLDDNFNKIIKPQNISIPVDFSSAAFFLAIPLLVKNSSVTIHNVNLNPLRTGFLDLLKKIGVNFEIKDKTKILNEESGTIYIDSKSNYYNNFLPIHTDEKITPTLIDELPLLFALATKIQGKHIFKGIKELRNKESDRIKSSLINLTKLGFNLVEKEDELIIEGNKNHIPPQTILNSFQDHRIAMTYIIYGLSCKNPITIQNCKNINTSFPSFIDILSSNKFINLTMEKI
jgi:3-phosphoshikimate 1-carboxyvinyltransferase